VPEGEIEDWIEQKLEEGVPEERLKKVLRNADRDPSLVDEVRSPFDEEEVEESGPGDFEFSFTDEEKTEQLQDKGKERDSGFELPDISIDASPPDIPDIPWIYIVPAFLLLAATAGGTVLILQETEAAVTEKQEVKDQAVEGCPASDVRINSVSVAGGEIQVEAAAADNTSSVVLDLYSGEEVVESRYARFVGTHTFTFGIDGTSVALRPVGCFRKQEELATG